MTAEALGSSDQMAMQNIMVGFLMTICFFFPDFFDTFVKKNIIASSKTSLLLLLK